MTALWIVGIVLFLLLVIFLSRVGAEMVFGEETGVTLRLGPVRVQVLPRKEKAKKPKKEKPPKKKEEKPKKEMPKITGRAILRGLPELWGIAKKGAKDDLSAHPYLTYGDFGGHRRGGPGGHGHSLRKAQRRHVDGDAGTYGAGADAGCTHTPGAGPAGRRDEGAGQSGHHSPDMGPDSHGLCLRHTAY